MNDGDFPSILQDQNGPGSQNLSVRALSLCPLPTDHPSSPPTLFSPSGPISSGGMCLHPGSARATGRPTQGRCSQRSQQGLGITGATGTHRRGGPRSCKPFRRGTNWYPLHINGTLQTMYFSRRKNRWEERETRAKRWSWTPAPGPGFHSALWFFLS